MPYSDQEAFLNAYLKNYAKAQQNAINSGKTGMSSARYTGQQAMNAAPTTLPDYGDIAGSFTTAYTKQLAAVEAQREKEAKAAQAAAEKEARAAAKAAKKASSSTTKSKKLKKEELKALDSELEEMAKTRVALQERKETQDTNTRERIKENVGDTAGISSLTAASRTFAPERKGSATKKRLSQRLAAGVKGLAKGASTYKQMQKARGGVSAEDSVDLGGVQTPQATAAKQKSRTKARAAVAKQNFTTQELDARLTATNQRMRELQKQGKTKTREYRQLQNQHDTYATALGVDSLAGRAGAIELGAVTGFGGGVANMGDATLRAIRGQSASMDIPEYEAASDDLQEANEQRDALIQMGRAYTDTPNGPVATPEFQQVLDRIASAKGIRAENQITPEQNKVVKSILDYSTEQTQKAQAGLNDQGRLLVGAIGGVSQLLPAAAAAAAAPEAAPVLIPVLMGASAAGNRVNELEQRGIPLNQAVLRGAMSGAVSGVTNKLPLEQGAELIAGGGPGVLRAMARQALSEGGQEASEYAADYGLDVLAGDPDAKFSLAELGQQALGGALGGAISAAGSSLIGSGVNRAREAFGANENAPVDTDVQQAEPVSPAPENSVSPEPESVSPSPETAAQQPLEATQEGIPELGVVTPDAAPKTAIDVIVDAYRSGTLTNKQIDQLKPGSKLRQAFEEATGVTLPDTSSETRKVLKAGMQEEIPYLRPVDSAENTGYDGTNETYTGGASDSLLTTPAESGSIPELMPTANQSVQEPIPTLADHPNTVGAAQRQFDRPEVASQSHMTRDTDNDYLQPLVQSDQGGEQKFTHERVSNADRMKIAANSMETESRDEIVSRLTSKEQWDADDTALAGSVLREWDLALGDMDKSGEAYKQALAQKMKFTQRISESNTMNAQALQMTQEFTTPETAVMQSQKSIKTAVDRVANGKNKRKFDQYKSDVETAIANAEDTATQKANDAVKKAIETAQQQVANAEDTATQKANGAVHKAIETAQQQVEDEADQPSVEDVLGRKLAAAVKRYATDGKEASVEDVVQSEMLSQLTKMATSDTKKGARPQKPKLTVEQKLQTALDNQETYTQAWEAAKEALTERYKDSAYMSSRLQAFFDDARESGLYGKDTIKQLVSKYTKDQGIDFKALVKESRGNKQATLREIQERIQDTFDMDKTQAQRIAEMAMNEYSKALSEAADANLKAIRGGKGKTSKSTHDQFLELLRMGVYDEGDVQAYAASKFGVQPLTAEQCQQILDLAERAEQLPANSRERVLLESEAATIAARNLSGSFRDAWDVWRYTSMLFNARTNEKNIGGNVSMGLNARAKDVVLAAMEWMINKVAPGSVERTTAIVTPFTEDGRALLAASAADADLNSYRQLSGTSERMNLARDMQRHREAFRSLAPSDSNNIVTKFLSGLDHLAARASAPLEVSDYEGAFGVLEGLRGINENMDAAIDWIRASAESATNKGVLGVAGLKNNYAWSLAQYLKANGEDASIFDATDAKSLALLDKARAHAIQQALINTYHAESKTASAVAKFKADLRGSDNFAHRVLGDIVEGQLPFVKTPINVAKQSLQYSPLGFVSTAAEGIKVARGTGDVNLMLDHAAASVTGSLLFALGGILAEKGLLTAGISDDEKDKANLEGRQEYSLQLVDNDGKLHSYTIDWANAAAIPMFAGAEYAKLAASDGVSLNSVASASQQVLEPLLEMSFLQGLNDNLESLRYSEDPYIYGMAKQSLSSYATQGIPTLAGQVARSIDPIRRSTYSGTTGIESDIGYTANKIRNKIPFLSVTGQPYIDAFGDTQPNTGGNFVGRLAYNMFSPGYYSETTDNPVQLGLLDLANSTGNDEVIPELAAKKLSWTVDKEKHTYQLSPQEYTDFATQQGQLRKDMAEAVLDSSYTEDQQVELIPELYSTAGKIAALDIVPDYSVGPEEQKRIDIYNQYGIDGLMNWIAYRKYASTDGKTGINQSEARAWLNDSDMSDAMKDAFWAASSSNWKSSR